MAKSAKHGYIKEKTYYKNESEEQKLRMGGGSWTISLKDIEEEDINRIQYTTEEHIYQISYEDAIRTGWETTFKKEQKLVVPIKNWTITTQNINKPDLPLIQQLQARLKEAEHIIKAVIIRKDYVIPTYVARMSEEYGDKYKLEI